MKDFKDFPSAWLSVGLILTEVSNQVTQKLSVMCGTV